MGLQQEGAGKADALLREEGRGGGPRDERPAPATLGSPGQACGCPHVQAGPPHRLASCSHRPQQRGCSENVFFKVTIPW